jgi:hypothetical protein
MVDTPLRIMLEEFKKGDYHLSMVQKVCQYDNHDPTYELVGIVTLEDVSAKLIANNQPLISDCRGNSAS